MYVKGVINKKGKLNKDIGNKYLICEEMECKYVVVPADKRAKEKEVVKTVLKKEAYNTGIWPYIDQKTYIPLKTMHPLNPVGQFSKLLEQYSALDDPEYGEPAKGVQRPPG